MGLTKAKGNMFLWLSHTWNPLAGECPHKCSYCSTESKKKFDAVREKYTGPPRIIEKQLQFSHGQGNTLFVCNCTDLFAEEVPTEMINRILETCRKYHHNKYVFLTKNPARYHEITSDHFPEQYLLGCTIETNRTNPKVSKAPSPTERAEWMKHLHGIPTFITVEPIMDFDTNLFAMMLQEIHPDFVCIGADSKGHKLPEPSAPKIQALLLLLQEYGVTVRNKDNLERLI